MTTKAYQAKRPVALLTAGGTANRTVATTDGSSVTMQPLNGGMLGSANDGRVVTKLVAASNAPLATILMADYVCDNTADEVEINAALASLPSAGGIVQLSEGTFTIAAQIAIGSGVSRVLRGMGMGATLIRAAAVGGSPAAGTSVNNYLIAVRGNSCELSDLTIDGNKTANPNATTMMGWYVETGQYSLISRVCSINSVTYGAVVNMLVGTVVRDCLFEAAGGGPGLLARGDAAAAAQATVVSGCTARGNGGGGFSTDAGAVLYSDCLAVSNTAHGFSIGGTTQVTCRSCVAQSNTTIGFNSSATRTQFIGCRSISSGTQGFQISAAEIQASGCSVHAPGQSGFYVTGSADNILISGCVVSDTIAGYAAFAQDAPGKALYVGCRAYNFAYWAFHLSAGEGHVRDCFAYGYAAQSTAITCDGGGRHSIDGCRILNNGGYGILVGTGVNNVSITNNLITESSLSSNGYAHIYTYGLYGHIDGNVCRDPAAGYRPSSGIQIDAAATDTSFGHNDPFGSGTSATVVNGGANTRYPAKQLASYTSSTDLLNPTTTANLVANTWLLVVTSPTFHVDSVRDIIEIVVSGCIAAGAIAAMPGVFNTQIVLDGGPAYLIGTEHSESTAGYQNALAGSAPLKLTGLTVGDHTFSVQVRSNQNGWAFLRSAGLPNSEFLTIQVMEYQA